MAKSKKIKLLCIKDSSTLAKGELYKGKLLKLTKKGLKATKNLAKAKYFLIFNKMVNRKLHYSINRFDLSTVL